MEIVVTSSPHRSAVFSLADDIVERDARSDPLFATESGITQ